MMQVAREMHSEEQAHVELRNAEVNQRRSARLKFAAREFGNFGD